MKEGCSRRIQVLDATKAGVSLFLDVLYTCGTRSDPDYQHALVALDLAHRWQVHRAVDVLADALKDKLHANTHLRFARSGCSRHCGAFGIPLVLGSPMFRVSGVGYPEIGTTTGMK